MSNGRPMGHPLDRWDNPKWTEDFDGKLGHEWSGVLTLRWRITPTKANLSFCANAHSLCHTILAAQVSSLTMVASWYHFKYLIIIWDKKFVFIIMSCV